MSLPDRSRRACLRTVVALPTALVLGGVGCTSKSSAPAKPKAKAKSAKQSVPLATRVDNGPWRIAATGSEFKPPIQIAEVPPGAWYCDMGTVHYAQSEAGDKTCKLCKMKLKHKAKNPAS